MNREQIAACIPHQGPMCLLDAVLSHDERGIVCRAVSHCASDNPLRLGQRLPALAGIEYAAQALAVHCALLDRTEARAGGMLAAARAVALHADRLDDIPGALTVSAQRLVAHDGRLLYAFTIDAAERRLLEGRVAVALSGHGGHP